MKTSLSTILLVTSIVIFSPGKTNSQNIGINYTGSTPNAKAALDIDVTGSPNKAGLLIPRMTTAERNSISPPIPESLLIYNTTTQCFEAWNATTGSWVPFGCIGFCSTPAAPAASSASGFNTTAFTANWTPVAGATTYYLDVSTSTTFSSFVNGYNNLNVGNVISFPVSGLSCSSTYYYRIRSGNSCGTSGNSNVITASTSTCQTSGICGSQTWMAYNLDLGTMLPSSSAPTNNGTIEKYCYNDVAANCATYGGLYKWNEMMNYTTSINCDPCGSGGRQGICPAGFHIPTDLEWSRYEHCLENSIAPAGTTSLATLQTTTGYRGATAAAGIGTKIKAASPTWDGSNASGFTALGSGYRHFGGTYVSFGNGYFWTATEADALNSYYRAFSTGNSQAYRISWDKNLAFSVRCIQD